MTIFLYITLLLRRLFSSPEPAEISTPAENDHSSGDTNLWHLLSTYLEDHEFDGSTEATVIHKKKEIRLFLEFLADRGHSMDAEDFTSADVRAHMRDMKRRNLARETIRTRRRSLHAWAAWMIELGVLSTNPVSQTKPPKSAKRRKPFLTADQFQMLLDKCQSDILTDTRRQAMLWILITTGMRRRELCLLRTEDLDWEHPHISIVNGKGQKERRVPFSPQAQEAVKRYLAHRQAYAEPALWVTQRGLPLRYDGLGLDMRRLYDRAGLVVKDRFHIFRRSFAREASRKRIPRQYILAIMGWADGQMLDEYTGAMQQEEEALDEFDGFTPFDR